MRRTMLAASIWLVATTAIFGSTRIIPVAGHLPGANGTAWTTDVSLRNNSLAAIRVDLVFRPEDGIARTRSINLDAKQSVLLEDAVGPAQFPGVNPSSWLGQLEVRGTGDVSASAHIFTSGPSGGTFGSTFEGFDPTALSTTGSMTGLISSVRFRSNIAFANPGDQTASIDYVLRRLDGSIAGTRRLEVPPHSTRQPSVGDSVATTTGDDRLSLTWSSNVPSYVVGSVIDNRSGDPTNAPSMSRDVTTLFFPVVGRAPGSNGTFWSTSTAVTSTSDVAGSVSFAYRDSGSGQTYTKTSAIAPLGTVATDDLNALVNAPAGLGSLTITSTTGVVGAARVFNTQTDGSTFGSAALPQDNVVESSKVRIDGVRRDGDYRLNVAISNNDSTTTSGRVRLFDDRGREVENEPFRVERGRSIQVAMNRGTDVVRAGGVEVETENGVLVTVTASNIDNHTGDTIQRESEQETERQNDIEMEINPRVTTIGVPVQFSLRHAGALVATVAWDFGDGTTGTGATASHAYATAGEFDVSVRIGLVGGASVRDREDVRVATSGAGSPGTGAIDFTFSPAAPAVGEQVVFTASGATGGGEFKWKFPGDVRPIGNVVIFTFTAAGAFEVELELEHGASPMEVTRIVTVGGGSNGNPGAGPLAFAYSPAAPAAGQQVTFTASGATAGGTYKWKFPGDIRKTGPIVTFTFAAAGSYEVELELEHGTTTAQVQRVVTVGGGSPGGGQNVTSIDFSWSPLAAKAGQPVTFTASFDRQPPAGSVVKWRFPDDSRAEGTTVSYTFPAAGTFEMKVEIEQPGQPSIEREKNITIAP